MNKTPLQIAQEEVNKAQVEMAKFQHCAGSLNAAIRQLYTDRLTAFIAATENLAEQLDMLFTAYT